MDIKQINTAIMFGSLTNTELNSIIDAVKFARAGLLKQNRRALRIGSTVTWNSTTSGVQCRGTVEKIATKYATVRDPLRGLWRIPMNMLETA